MESVVREVGIRLYAAEDMRLQVAGRGYVISHVVLLRQSGLRWGWMPGMSTSDRRVKPKYDTVRKSPQRKEKEGRKNDVSDRCGPW